MMYEEMSEGVKMVIDAAAGMSAEEIKAELMASEKGTALENPDAVASYIAHKAQEHASGENPGGMGY